MPNVQPKSPQQEVMNLLQAAIKDIKRGDRIDALDIIRMAQDKIVASLPEPLRPKPATAPVRLESSQALGERLWDAQARLGKIIYLPAAHDGEIACEDLAEFIVEEMHEDYVAREFGRLWPEFRYLRDDAFYEDDDDRGRIASALDMIQSHCKLPYLVRIEHTIKESLRDAMKETEYPFGTWRAGWSYSRCVWTLAHSVEQAAERAIELAEAQRREAWDAAGALKPKGKSAQKGKARG